MATSFLALAGSPLQGEAPRAPGGCSGEAPFCPSSTCCHQCLTWGKVVVNDGQSHDIRESHVALVRGSDVF